MKLISDVNQQRLFLINSAVSLFKPCAVERYLQKRPENVRPLEQHHTVPPLLPEQQALQEEQAKLHPFKLKGVCVSKSERECDRGRDAHTAGPC